LKSLSALRLYLYSLGKVIVFFSAGTVVFGATPLEELRAVAQLTPAVDLAKLKSGQILCTRGELGSFTRGISLQSCYFIRAPMQVVGDALLHWNPPEHKDLDIRLYQEYALPGSAETFRKLRLETGLQEDQWLLRQSETAARSGRAGELHLTKSEVSVLAANQNSTNAAWQEILRKRSEALARGGLSLVPPYLSGISPSSEFSGLLSLVPKAARHFQSIIGVRPLSAGGKPAGETVAYWETSKLQDHTTLQLGVFAAQKGSDSWQLVNCVYYPSDTYFMALDLFQLWPVEGGTLVWQVGLASAPFRNYLAGMDRYFAGRLMTSETLATIRAFRSDVEKSH
jgi:hypothetical protein